MGGTAAAARTGSSLIQQLWQETQVFVVGQATLHCLGISESNDIRAQMHDGASVGLSHAVTWGLWLMLKSLRRLQLPLAI